jgi:hypothetical protein
MYGEIFGFAAAFTKPAGRGSSLFGSSGQVADLRSICLIHLAYALNKNSLEASHPLTQL